MIIKTPRIVFSAPLAALLAFVPMDALAVSGTWIANTSGTWSDVGNWSGNVVADGAGATGTVLISETGAAAARIVTLNQSITLGTLNIGIGADSGTFPAAGYTLTGTNGAVLTMDNNGAQAVITQMAVPGKTAVGTGVINTSINMTAGGLKIATAAGGSITVGNNTGTGAQTTISTTATSGTTLLTLSHSGGNLFNCYSDISDGNYGGQVGLLIDSTSGPVGLAGNNTFTGDLVISRGQLRANSTGAKNALGFGIVRLGDANSGAAAVTLAPGGNTYNNDIVVSSLGTGVVSIDAGSLAITGGTTGVFNGTITLGRSMTAKAKTGVLYLNGNISGAGALTIGATDTNAANAVVLAGTNTYTGGFITDGDVLVKMNNATVPGTGTWTIGPTAVANHNNDLRIDNTSGSDMTLANNNALVLSSFSFVGTNSMNMGTGAVTLNKNQPAIITVQKNTLTIGGVISGAKAMGNAGAGTLVLGKVNTYTGATYVGGNLSASALANGGSASSIGASTNVASNLVLNRGTLQYTGAATTTDRLFTLGNGGGTIDSSGTGALQFTNTGSIATTGGVTLSSFATYGAGATTITVSNFNGTNTTQDLAVGQVVTGSNIAAGTTITAILNANQIQISQATTGTSGASGPSNSLSFGALDRTLTLAGSNTGDNLIAGVLSNPTANTLGVTKTGVGKWILNGANTYTGQTAINQGVLAIGASGSINNSTKISVAAGATLDVTNHSAFTVVAGQTLDNLGTVDGNVQVSGLLSGNGTYTAGLSLLTGSELKLNLNKTVSEGLTYDQLQVTGGNVALGGVLDLFLNGGQLSVGEGLLLIANSGAGSLSGSFSGITIDGIAVQDFLNNTFTYSGQKYEINSVDSSNFGVQNDLMLIAVPEPSTWAMIVGGMSSLVLLQRRSRRKMS